MDNQLEINKQGTIKINPIHDENIQQNKLDDNFVNVQQEIDKDKLLLEKDNAILAFKEHLKMQEQFDVAINENDIYEGNMQIEKIQEETKKLEELEKLEKRLIEFEKKLSSGNDMTPVSKEIIEGYIKNEYGDIEKEKLNLKNSQKFIKENIQSNVQSLNERIASYKEKLEKSLDTRQKENNDKFNSEDIKISSKSKKDKGRKKVSTIKGKVIGATEESVAMNYDMQHRMKKIEKWYKKPPQINDNDLALTGNEFEIVFKNKSGSALDIKTVMEKIALLDIKIDSMEEMTDQKRKYISLHNALKKTLKVVCAANGIDSDTCTYFKQDTAEEQAEVKKKVDFANSVYKNILKEYRSAVFAINEDNVLDYKFKSTVKVKEQNEIKIEKEDFKFFNKTVDKDVRYRADMTVFFGAIHGIRQKNASKISDERWNDAVDLCRCFDAGLYKDLYKRQEAVVEETNFLTNFANENYKEVLGFVNKKMVALNENGISIENAFDKAHVEKNIGQYRQLASIINIINHVRQQNGNKEDFANLFGEKTEYEKYKTIAKLSLLEHFSEYVDGISKFQSLNDREQKLLLYKGYTMKEKLKNAGLEFDTKWKDVNLGSVEISNMCEFAITADEQYRKVKAEPMYNDTVNELNEYLEGIKNDLAVKQKEYEVLKSAVDVSDAVKLLTTGKLLAEKYAQKVKDIEEDIITKRGLVEEAKSSPIPFSKVVNQNKEVINTAKKAMEKAKKETVVIDGLKFFVDNVFSADEKKEEIINEIRSKYGKTELDGMFDEYLSKKKEAYKDVENIDAEKKTKEYELAKAETNKQYKQSYFELVSCIGTEIWEQKWKEYFDIHLKYEVRFNSKTKESVLNNQESYKKNIIKQLKKMKEEDKQNLIVELGDIYNDVENKKTELDEFNSTYEQQRMNYLNIAVANMSKTNIEIMDKINDENLLKPYEDRRIKYMDEYDNVINDVKAGKYGEWLTEGHVLGSVASEDIELYVNTRKRIILETNEYINKMYEEARIDFQNKYNQLKEKFTEEELNKYEGVAEFKKFLNLFSSGGALSNEMINKGLLSLKVEKIKAEKLEKAINKLNSTIATTEKVLNKEKDALVSNYDEEAKEKSYKTRKDKNDKCFTVLHNSVVDKVKRLIEKYGLKKENNNLGAKLLSEKFSKYKNRTDKLIDEKQGFNGVTYNTLAIQDFLLNTSDEKYLDLEEEYKNKKSDAYNLEEKDFKAGVVEDGFATVDFKKLMYKRMKLMQWVEANKHLALKDDADMKWYQKVYDRFRSFRQQQYDRRVERLEKINKFIKLYCEVNGVDFETGELLCDKVNLTEKDIEAAVKEASVLLDETMIDIQGSYFEKEEEEEEEEEEEKTKQKEEQEKEATGIIGILTDKIEKIKQKIKDAEYEKKILEETEEEVEDLELSTELFSKELFSVDTSAFKNETRMRTAHAMASITTKIAECKMACKVSVAVGKKSKEEKQAENEVAQYGGGVALGASVSFNALSSEFMAKYGTKVLGLDAGAHVKGKIEIGKVAADANLQAGLRSDDGKFSPHVNLEAGIEMALLKLQGSVGVKMMGVGVDAELSFIAGLVGKANVSFKNWKLEIDLQAAIGVGFGVKLSFDFSELKETIVEKAKQAAESVYNYVKESLVRSGITYDPEIMTNIIMKDFSDGGFGFSNDEI